MLNKKFIEVQFPIDELSEFGYKEKNSMFDTISGIHVWWARRPTSVVRGLILASLIDYPSTKAEIKKINELIIRTCTNFKAIPNQMNIKGEIKKYIKKNYPDSTPKLLDSFSGGSAIPLEAARLGLDSYGIDLNPVAVLIGKATAEYLQRFDGALIKEIKKWWQILKKTLLSKLKEFYINPVNDRTILAYIWARQIKCKNNKCNALIPMLSELKLTNKKEKQVVLKPNINKTKDGNEIKFTIQRNNEIDFNPIENKIFSKGKVTCPCPECGLTLSNHEVMELVKKKKYDDRLLVVVEREKNSKKRIYRFASDKDFEIINEVKEELKKYNDLIPLEKIPDKVSKWRVQNYGILEWKELFNDRQMLFSIICTEEIKKIYNDIKNSYDDDDYIKAIMLFLSFTFSRILTHNSKFTHWRNRGEGIAQTWSRIGLFMKGGYPELNPFSDFTGTPIRYLKFIENINKNNLNFSNSANISQGDAMKLEEFAKSSIDLIITDPPYYDAMLYANPADFFYIWHKRCLEDIFPELFLLPLTPKENEIIQSKSKYGGDIIKAKEFYEKSLATVLKEYNRVLKPRGIGIIMFTHKSTTAWEALIYAIIESNLTICAAWPIKTETKGGIRSLNKVSLASSIALVFKKIEKKPEIYFETNFRNILEKELNEKLKLLLLDLELYGADFFISAIGFSLNIFTRYIRVISQKTGDPIPISNFLDLVRKIVNNFLLTTVLEKEITQNNDDISNLYIIWCWFFRNNDIDLDDALKLAQSFGIELDDLRKKKLVKLEKQKFKLLLASNKEREQFLIKNKDNLRTLIDNLHLLAILWKNNDKNLDEEVKKVEIEYSENIWKVGQALAEFFPNNHNEHNCLQGLLARYGKAKSKSDLKKWV